MTTVHPAMAGVSEAILLSGFSGAQVALLRTAGGAAFVRKAAWDAAVGATLRVQMRRQQHLAGALTGVAGVPPVLDAGEISGLFYFDMAFVPSRDAVSFLALAPFAELDGFAGQVEQLMAALAALPPDPASAVPPDREVVLRKLDEIAIKTGGAHAATLDPLRRAVLLIPSLGGSEGAATLNHGDLSFENLLVGRDGGLWLIDPIASPFDHHWIDWSKLFQECEGRWHVHRGRPIATGVTWWLRNRWFAAAARQSPDYPMRHYLLLGLSFARILPYARTDADRAFVSERVQLYGRRALAAIGESP